MIIENAFLSKRGGYCLPQEAFSCNNYTSRIVQALNSWKCLPKDKLFGREDGCRTIGCNGSIKYYLTGIIWQRYKTANFGNVQAAIWNCLMWTRIRYTRWAFIPFSMYFMSNKLIESEYSHLDRIRNAWASQIFNVFEVIMPNFQVETCTGLLIR